MDCLPIPQFCLDFLLRSKTCLNERPPSATVANGDFPLSSKSEHVVYTSLYKVQIMLLHSGFTLVQAGYLAHDVMHCLHCFECLVL